MVVEAYPVPVVFLTFRLFELSPVILIFYFQVLSVITVYRKIARTVERSIQSFLQTIAIKDDFTADYE